MAVAQTKIYVTVGQKSMTATLVDNETTRALISLLNDGPITVEMNDYGGFEKVGALPKSFPTDDMRITTEPGDIMLYQGNSMVIFFTTNTWSYTRMGKMDTDNVNNLKAFLGSGPITLILSLTPISGISDIIMDSDGNDNIYDINGRPVVTHPLINGFYIINRKKKYVI